MTGGVNTNVNTEIIVDMEIMVNTEIIVNMDMIGNKEIIVDDCEYRDYCKSDTG